MRERKLKVFLCHASQDKPIVKELYQKFKAEGWIDPWLDKEKLLPGQNWQAEITNAVKTADNVIIFLSKTSVNKDGFVQRELRLANDTALEKAEGTIFLIPLRLDDCEVPRSLKPYQWSDYYGEEVDETYTKLLQSLEIRLNDIESREAFAEHEAIESTEPLGEHKATESSEALAEYKDTENSEPLGEHEAIESSEIFAEHLESRQNKKIVSRSKRRPQFLIGPIIGGLSHDSANIWARTDGSATLHVWLATRADTKDAEHVGQTDLYSNEGFAGVVPIKNLKSDTQYYYAISLRENKPPKSKFHRFTTFPKENTRHSFSFVFGSNYLPVDETGSQTFDEIHKQIAPNNLRFGLLLGNQIYADNANQNGIGRIAVTLDDYRSVYAYAWSRPSLQYLLPDLPFFMILDEHEVDDGWRLNDPNRSSTSIPADTQFLRQLAGVPVAQRSLPLERVRAALKVYYEHQAMHAPKMLVPLQADLQGIFRPGDEGSFAYKFTFGGAAFFILDVRTQRVKSKNVKNVHFGEAQWRALTKWLIDVKDKYPVKFLVSSSTILYQFWLDMVQDRWSGFRSDRERLFEFLAVNEVEGVHILTGGLNSAHAVSAELQCPSGNRIPIWEFCSSPFEGTTSLVTNTYRPLFSKWIKSQKIHLYKTGNNFGTVYVDFKGQNPKVAFTLHYNQDGWKSLPPIGI